MYIPHSNISKKTSARILFRRLFVGIFSLLSFNICAQGTQEPKVFEWITHKPLLIQLDSIVKNSKSYALRESDYNTVLLKKAINEPASFKSYKDSLAAEVAIAKVASNFFSHLANGNKYPALAYQGVKFKASLIDVSSLIKKYLVNTQLHQLVELLNKKNIEVKTILDTLHKYQDVASKNQEKIRLLTKAANEYRWLAAIKEKQQIVLVNIPSAQLKVYEGDKIKLEMRLILGKKSTPTKTLSTYIKQVTINPYWTVPMSIIINEMLPKIKTDIDYLSRNHLEVLNSNYKPLNPYQINWHNIDLVNFPYIIRQSTGCENSLGILKLEFDSPFAIFLHDTPEKKLFAYKNRFYSHGCMRMEKPVEMGRLLLEDNLKAIDSIDLTKCYLNPKPIYIPLSKKIPLIVWYSQVDFDSNNNLLFYKNVYNR